MDTPSAAARRSAAAHPFVRASASEAAAARADRHTPAARDARDAFRDVLGLVDVAPHAVRLLFDHTGRETVVLRLPPAEAHKVARQLIRIFSGKY
ncbi:hypothetical protein GCM10009716_36010 [Streptomyces sodiiphilus]|uniref:Uncharacterized protein n=1 Tax=Streptomyces sodiiphilus TaxID=226217 RepID=A0ABP5AWS9_9ACTN